MKKLIPMILIAIILSSCGYQLWFKPKYITYKYNGQPTRLDSLILIEGYYVSEAIVPENTNLYGTYVELLLLYQDGSILRTISSLPRDDYENKIDKLKSKDNKFKHLDYRWGIYQLNNDTIKAQIILNDGPMSSPGVSDTRFVIVSDSVLKLVYEKTLVSYSDYPPSKLKGDEFFYFYSYPNRIGSTSNPYLKKKWFWDKETYKHRKKE